MKLWHLGLLVPVVLGTTSLLDLAILVPIKVAVVEVLPISDAQKASAISSLCHRAYVADENWAGTRCYFTYASERLQKAQATQYRSVQVRRAICRRADQAFAGGPPPELLEGSDGTWWLWKGTTPSNELLVEIAESGYEAKFDRRHKTIMLYDGTRGSHIDCGEF